MHASHLCMHFDARGCILYYAAPKGRDETALEGLTLSFYFSICFSFIFISKVQSSILHGKKELLRLLRRDKFFGVLSVKQGLRASRSKLHFGQFSPYDGKTAFSDLGQK